MMTRPDRPAGHHADLLELRPVTRCRLPTRASSLPISVRGAGERPEHQRVLCRERVLREQRADPLQRPARPPPLMTPNALPANGCTVAADDTIRDLRGRLRLQRLPGRYPAAGRSQQRQRRPRPAAQPQPHLRAVPAQGTSSPASTPVRRPHAGGQRLHDQPPADRGLLRLPQRGPRPARCTRTCPSRSTSRQSGFTCGSDARFPVIESPNGNPDADTEISPTSHELNEAITDPDTETGWYDSSGFENGDECAYIFGATQRHGRAALQPDDLRPALPDPAGVQQQRLQRKRRHGCVRG